MSSTPTTNKSVVRSFFQLLSAEDYDRAFALQDSAGMVHLQSPRQSIPAADWHAIYRRLMESTLLGGVQYELDYLTAEDTRVSAITRGSARIFAEHPYDNVYHWLFHLRDGVIVETHEFMDTLYAERTLHAAGWVGRRGAEPAKTS